MTLREYLESTIDKVYSQIIKKHCFELVETFDQGMGVLNTYQNKDFKFRVINDRGLINAELAPSMNTDKYLDVDLFHAFIKLSESDLTSLNNWDKKLIISKTLSCEEVVQFLDYYYDQICKMLSINEYMRTISSLNKIAEEHNHLLFGKPKSRKNAS